MYYTYILRSLKDKRLYIGSTRDLEKRIKAHNSGKVRSTKSRRPFELIYYEEFDSYTEARVRENFLKSGAGRGWIRENIIDNKFD